MDYQDWRQLSDVSNLLRAMSDPVEPDMEMLSTVALLRDIPEAGLVRGQVGTVVEHLSPAVYEVEFSDDSGRTYALVAMHSSDLMRLHHKRLEQVA